MFSFSRSYEHKTRGQLERQKTSTNDTQIKSLEDQIAELNNLIKKQKEKIVQAFLRFAPEQDLLQELIIAHLEFTELKKQKSNSPNYDEKCEEYEIKCQRIKEKLRRRLPKEDMNEIRHILDDCEELVSYERELEAKIRTKSLAEQNQLPQIADSNPSRLLITDGGRQSILLQEIYHKETEELKKELERVKRELKEKIVEEHYHQRQVNEGLEDLIEVIPSSSRNY